MPHVALCLGGGQVERDRLQAPAATFAAQTVEILLPEARTVTTRAQDLAESLWPPPEPALVLLTLPGVTPPEVLAPPVAHGP